MNLIHETKQFAVWFARLNKVCLTTRPLWTLFVIGASVVSSAAKLAAFLLPLKVVLLAGSEGVPRYFAFFIEPADKDFWILLLAAGAIVSYVTHLALDAIIQRMSLVGGESVAQQANKLSVLSNQQQAAQRYYGRITRLSADVIFLILALGVVSLLALDLMLKLLVLAVAFLIITALWLRLGSSHEPSWIQRNSKLYISVVTSSLFLAGFLLIVHPYIDGDGPNILLSLVSIVLLKRSSKVSDAILNAGVSLTSARDVIDPLMFRSGKVIEKERPSRVAMRELFPKEYRDERAKKALPPPFSDGDVDMQWEDPRIIGFTTFRIISTLGNGEPKKQFRQHNYSKRKHHLLEREQHLFQYVDREELLAPAQVGSYSLGEFRCNLLEYGQGQPLRLIRWRRVVLQVLQQHWSIRPPRQLIKDFKLTLPLIWKRFTQDLVVRTQIAVEDEDDERTLNQFMVRLDEIQTALSRMPLYIANHEMTSANTVQADNDAGVRLMFWGRWSIEPMGFFLPRRCNEEQLELAIDAVRQSGREIPSNFTASDLRFAHHVAQIEKAITSQQYRKALELMARFNQEEWVTVRG